MQKGIKDIRENFLQELLEIAKHMTKQASEKKIENFTDDTGITNLDRHLSTFEQDTDGHWCRHSTTCPGLSEVSKHLQSVKKAPESLPDNELHTENVSAAERTYGQQCEASSHGHSPGSSVAPVTIGKAG